jgi:hypothetical protein
MGEEGLGFAGGPRGNWGLPLEDEDGFNEFAGFMVRNARRSFICLHFALPSLLTHHDCQALKAASNIFSCYSPVSK